MTSPYSIMARFFSILNALLHIVTANKFRYNTFIHCFYCWNKGGVANGFM